MKSADRYDVWLTASHLHEENKGGPGCSETWIASKCVYFLSIKLRKEEEIYRNMPMIKEIFASVEEEPEFE